MARTAKQTPASGDSPAAAEAPAPDNAQDTGAGAVEASEPEPVMSKADAEAVLAGHFTAAELATEVEFISRRSSRWHAAAEHHARAFVKAGDHAMHAKFSRLAGLIAEFRNGLATV